MDTRQKKNTKTIHSLEDEFQTKQQLKLHHCSHFETSDSKIKFTFILCIIMLRVACYHLLN